MIQQDLNEELKCASEDEVYRRIRADIIETLHRYVYNRIPPGGFLSAVLANDLGETIRRTDHVNERTLKEIVIYCHMQLPSTCWGTHDKVESWLSIQV